MVRTRVGALEGAQEECAGRHLNVFRGIPYAEPPVGPLRWRRPEPVRPWRGTRRAVEFGPSAPQSPPILTALPAEALVANPYDEAGCLTLNVWAPAAAHDRPVLAWIHGGSFMNGSSAMATYDGARLAAEGDVVVVSLNYRLGALGWAPVAGQANVGLLDQALALRWVRDNVDAFGGDPDRVTVFGESAGGGSVLHLMASPEGAGLFQRAIAQSGATDLSPSSDQINDVAERVVQALASVEEHDPATAPVAAVLRAQRRVLGDIAATATVGVMPFHPAIDGDVVPTRPPAAFSNGASADVDLVTGITADEMTVFLDPAAWTLEEERFRKRATRYLTSLGLEAERLPDLLAAYASLQTPSARWTALRTDAEMWLPCLDAAEARVKGPGRTFLYRFDWAAAPPAAHLGACHGIDVPFTFGTLDRCGWDAFVGADADADRVGRDLRGAWIAFATTGDPSTASSGPWPAYDTDDRATMIFDRRSRLELDPRGAMRRAWAVAR